MSSPSDVTLMVTIAATVIGVGVALAMWRRQVRLERISRRTHPSMHPPLALTVVATGDDDAATRRWAVTVRPDAPAISIDIVTFRASGSRQPWSSEPIVEPIRIEPGGSAALPSTFAAAPAYDAVIGWTEHRVEGDVERSRTFRCLDVATGTVRRAGANSGLRRLRLDLVVSGLLLAALVLAVWGLVSADDEDAPPADPEPTMSSAVPTTSPPATTRPATTVATSVATTVPPTTIGATTTSAPPTTAPASTAAPTTAPDVPRVEARGTIGECRFGSACLIAGFRVVGFEAAPSQYVCEFADGSRVTFGFGGDGVDVACATGSADATITIEVAGVRSETITRETVEDG